MPNKNVRKKKIAVLGGGLGSLSTVFELTHPDNPQRDEVDITVYQLGWRLGGKGASGRNLDPEFAYRIEEHGLHIFFGFYDNAFRMMQQLYAEMGRAPDAPLATWEDAFKPHSLIVLQQKLGSKWTNWVFDMPTNHEVPGTGNLWLSPLAYIEMALELLLAAIRRSVLSTRSDSEPEALGSGLRRVVEALTGETEEENLKIRSLQAAHELSSLAVKRDTERLDQIFEQDLDFFHDWIGEKPDDMIELALGVVAKIAEEIRAYIWAEVRAEVEGWIELLRIWILINFALGTVIGGIRDKLYKQGLDAINDQDFRQWLSAYIVDDGGLTIDSPVVTNIYAGAFSYIGGDVAKPDMEAGTYLRTLIRMLFTYKGAVMWEMQAGMGCTIFTPFYEVLKKRGVKFEFFHRVENLTLSADGKSVETIEIQRQVDLPPGGYAPLLDVKGLPSWPSTPLWDRIVDGQRIRGILEERGVDLEAYYPADAWPGTGHVSLRAGEDFDLVLIGISLAALPCVAGDLVAARNDWQQMVDNVATTRTQSYQLWLKPTLTELGWKLEPPVLTCYDVSQTNTWSDMAFLIEREGWPALGEHYPLDLAYFTGTMTEIPGDDPCDPDRGLERVKATALDMLENHIAHLWPRAVSPSGELDWDLLVDNRKAPGRGPERLDSQFMVSIQNPSDRYVQALTGTSRYRLAAGESGFDNVVITGDWIDNTFNIGAVEPSVMSGMSASNAISGYPALSQIVGWNFGEPEED